MLGLRADLRDWHLVRPPIIFNFFTVDFFRSGPSLRTAQNDHGPMGISSRRWAGSARFVLYGPDLFNDDIHRGRHRLMHELRIGAFYEVRLITITQEQILQFLMADAREHCWTCDLVPVEVQDGQYGAVMSRIEKFIGVPG